MSKKDCEHYRKIALHILNNSFTGLGIPCGSKRQNKTKRGIANETKSCS